MHVNTMPTREVVKAIADAVRHARDVSGREHIKADRVERVNQFIVSLRRHLGYMPDEHRTCREYLSAQLARKEVWYDIAVLNSVTLSGLSGYSALHHNHVTDWLGQAEVMMPANGDLCGEIERDMLHMKGCLLMAESINQTCGQINNSAEKVLGDMAVLAEDL